MSHQTNRRHMLLVLLAKHGVFRNPDTASIHRWYRRLVGPDSRVSRGRTGVGLLEPGSQHNDTQLRWIKPGITVTIVRTEINLAAQSLQSRRD